MDKAYFISDAHLGARYIDDPAAHERRVVDMLRLMGRDAHTIYLLGDMLDFWYEYRHVVPKGFVRFFGEIARLTDAGVKVYWFKGNHDMWTDGYLAEQLGVTVVDEELVTEIGGKKFFLAHGDGLGRLPLPFKIVRSIFRNRFCQALGRAIHPWWLMSFGFKWSLHNRGKRGYDIERYQGDDNEQQMQFAIKYSQEHPDIDYYVNGHRHVAIDTPVPGSKARFVCLGDFFRQNTYAVFDGETLSLRQYEQNQPV